MSGAGHPSPGDPPQETRGEAPDEEAERPLPRGCNPLVFGVVMATVEMAALIWLLYGR